ncbi:type I-E CRISPR-associated endonuclease Cas1e [Nesterenkonia sp. CL21]|uniref:type I-E CRISPR-associated endonuclease Cas1e n=1 Tax=Nesterenkonia sp. CL21 TaxID=3064894 RepID=UPI00287A6164|nr:type I-E CRISPR-associated endonuclease Cas1e [Nesterenkonia sp. CL21]MDS2172672.1 type I-E CRISPR-associated endonuclease Cas1e [Nesterenkonia sp. CL21]
MSIPGVPPPVPTELLRAEDRLSFVYLERSVIHREENAITSTDGEGTVHLPAVGLGCLMLGPGTRITHAAISLLGDCGVSVVWCGEQGVRFYAHGSATARNSTLLQRQAALVSNTRSRLRVARRMYQIRFPGEDVSSLTMDQLRGREGARVRKIYRQHAERVGIPWSGRYYRPGELDASNPVNQALTAGNAALYGVTHSVITALGCSPGLGFVHSGTSRAFVYDVADLFKAETTIPAAFDAAVENTESITSAVRRRLRDYVVETNMLARCARQVQSLLAETSRDPGDDWNRDADDLQLWDPDGGVDAGKNHEEGTA